jgi:hypothetical protein
MQPEELFALRSYLQRGETRLAAMHTAAGAYVSGAGLLIFFTAIFQNFVPRLMSLVIEYATNDSVFDWPNALLAGWLLPFALALFIPLYCLKLLIQELVVLYFVPHVGASQQFLPRFAITPLSMPLDDPVMAARPSIKSHVTDCVYAHETHVAVAPNHNSQDARSLRRTLETYPHITDALLASCAFRRRSGDSARLYNVRAAKVGLLDRTLFEEAAHMEASLVRLSARLRLMAFRYFRSLLALIWTFIFLVLILLTLTYVKNHEVVKHLPELFALTGGVVWSGFTPYIVCSPLRWIRKFGSRDASSLRGDIDLSHFDGIILILCFLSFGVSFAGLFYLTKQGWIADYWLFAVAPLAVMSFGGLAISFYDYFFSSS